MRTTYHKPVFFTATLLVLLLLTGCSDYPCAKADLYFRLIGFSDAEADTIILRRLPKNGSIAVDSFVFSPANPIRFNRSGDTLFPVAYPSTALLASAYDYQLNFPGAVKTVRITAIREEQSYGRRGTKKDLCINSITGCLVDGIAVMPVSFPNTIYLHR